MSASVRPGLGEDALDQRQQAPDVVAGGQLRHHAAVSRVQRDLGVQRVRQEPRLAVVDGHAGLVAGGFDAEDAHGPDYSERLVPGLPGDAHTPPI